MGRVDTCHIWVPVQGKGKGKRERVTSAGRRIVRPYLSKLPMQSDAKAYDRVYMWTFDGDAKTKHQAAVHRLVLLAFMGPPPPGTEGSHLSGNSRDNRLVNLAWEDNARNMRRKYDHGTIPKGEQHHHAKFTADDILCIRARVAAGVTKTALARQFDVSKSTVARIARGETWSHLSGQSTRLRVMTDAERLVRKRDQMRHYRAQRKSLAAN